MSTLNSKPYKPYIGDQLFPYVRWTTWARPMYQDVLARQGLLICRDVGEPGSVVSYPQQYRLVALMGPHYFGGAQVLTRHEEVENDGPELHDLIALKEDNTRESLAGLLNKVNQDHGYLMPETNWEPEDYPWYALCWRYLLVRLGYLRPPHEDVWVPVGRLEPL